MFGRGTTRSIGLEVAHGAVVSFHGVVLVCFELLYGRLGLMSILINAPFSSFGLFLFLQQLSKQSTKILTSGSCTHHHLSLNLSAIQDQS
jgi:hypothetical protein